MGLAKLSHTVAMILRALNLGYQFGFEIMEATGLPSGTVYPALRRLEHEGLVKSHWESEAAAASERRPARCYYVLTPAGTDAEAAAGKRYPLLSMLPQKAVRTV
jgi:PadR family transcriptional regulator, regulatory protein PadR